MKLRLIFILFSVGQNFLFCQHSSDTTFMGWPEKVHSITYRTSGVPDSLIAFHENGKIKSKVFYEKGKINGAFVTWYNTGVIYSRVLFKNGKANGETSFYHPNGNLKVKGTFIDNKREGEFDSYDSTGYKKRSVFYRNNKREGKSYRFYSNGNISSRMQFKNNHKEDSVVDYYKSGRIKLIRFYKKGRMNGVRMYYSEISVPFNGNFISYHENGAIERECFCINGKPEGIEKTFTSKGKIIKLATYKNGLADGEALYYDLNEKIIMKELYRKGKFKKSEKEIDPNTRIEHEE